jgi:hypothetical protein
MMHNKSTNHKEERNANGAIAKQDFSNIIFLQQTFHVKEAHQHSRHRPKELNDVEFGFHVEISFRKW